MDEPIPYSSHAIACKLIVVQNLEVDDWDAIEIYA
jgi:hypothetical protein